MAGVFVADPTVLEQNGRKVIENSEAFKDCVTEIYNIVDQMITSDYVSREAAEIGRKVESYQPDMDNLARAIGDYGRFLDRASVIVRNNQDDIISGIN